MHEASYRLGITDAALIAPVGSKTDPLQTVLRNDLEQLGSRLDGLIETSGSTPCVNLTLDENGDLAAGVADTELVERLTAEQV